MLDKSKHFKISNYIENAEFIIYDQKSEIKDINDILVNQPEKQTFIFVKEMLRCAKTLEKEHIGIMYDRYSKRPDDSVIIQGFVGRLTGYDYNQKSLCYTHIPSIEKYSQLWDTNFEDTKVEWQSHSTTFKNGVLSGKNTFNSVDNIDGLSNDSSSVTSEEAPIKDEKSSKTEIEPLIIKRKTLEEIKEYYNQNLKDKIGGRGPNKKKPNSEGFYEAKINGVTKVFSSDDMFKQRRWALNTKGLKSRCSPCYTDVSDKSSLEWWLIYYE